MKRAGTGKTVAPSAGKRRCPEHGLILPVAMIWMSALCGFPAPEKTYLDDLDEVQSHDAATRPPFLMASEG